MKFEILNLKNGGICLIEKIDNVLILLGDIKLHKEEKKNGSYCVQFENCFDYNRIENALCGKTGYSSGGIQFTPKRIIVIQMCK